jgi:homoserine kinase type II
MEIKDIAQILTPWEITFSDLVPHAECYGSPERSQFRCVLKDSKNKMYLLERIHFEQLTRKNKIARQLYMLKKSNPLLPIHPYCQSPHSSSWVEEMNHQYWMLSPYLPATPLQRPSYLEDAWRGEVYAHFLLDLHSSSGSISGLDQNRFEPTLENYIHALEKSIQIREPSLYKELAPFILHLKQNFFPLLSQIPHSFSHGDYHPLNLLWEGKTLCAVIDWEFSGFHPELYDLANLVSCLGMEHPSALEKDISNLLIKTIKNAQFHAEVSWKCFMDLMLAIRFAWLSEWLRKKDEEMINLEIAYMHLLWEHSSKLVEKWGIFSS